MEGKIRSYVNELFKNAPKNKKAQELKEEICANLLDKYHELVEKGLSESELSSVVCSNMLNICLGGKGRIDAGDLCLPVEKQKVLLPCGTTTRWSL